MMLIAFIATLLFYVTVSVAEGYYFHVKSKVRLVGNKYQHWLLTAIRLPIWILLHLITGSLFITIGTMMMFPFIHDGIYYYTRNKLNPFSYPDKFWANPDAKKSNAVMDFTLTQRSLLAVAGAISIVIGLL